MERIQRKMKHISLERLWNKKRIILLIVLTLINALVLSACGSSESDRQIESQNRGIETTEAEIMDTGKKYSYRTEEIWCDNNGKQIYGIAYIPDTEEEHKPLVVFSHELGNSHTAGIPYAERLAEAGYAAYTFDFCGGTVGVNKSDGDNIGI